MNFVECLVVGDDSIGKKCLIITYTTDKFPSEYIPSVLDFYTHTVLINKEVYTLRLSIAPVFYNLLRPLHYQQSDVFLVCFSVVQPSTFQNVKKTWVPEILHHNPKTPFILVGTQIDLRTDVITLENLTKNKQKPISMETGEQLAKELNAIKYIECSALTKEGLKTVFDEACLAKLLSRPQNQSKTKTKCEIC